MTTYQATPSEWDDCLQKFTLSGPMNITDMKIKYETPLKNWITSFDIYINNKLITTLSTKLNSFVKLDNQIIGVSPSVFPEGFYIPHGKEVEFIAKFEHEPGLVQIILDYDTTKSQRFSIHVGDKIIYVLSNSIEIDKNPF